MQQRSSENHRTGGNFFFIENQRKEEKSKFERDKESEMRENKRVRMIVREWAKWEWEIE